MNGDTAAKRGKFQWYKLLLKNKVGINSALYRRNHNTGNLKMTSSKRGILENE
jgi:hypothetical protein